MNSFPETRASLLCRLRDPVDGGAWKTFVDVYGPLVYGDIRRRGVSEPDAEDLTQEVFSRCLRSFRKFEYEPARGRFRDWLGVLVRNEVFRFWRDRGREMADASLIHDNDLLHEMAGRAEPEWNEQFQARVLEVALDVCRDRFDPPTWRAFSRVWIDQQSADQVAIEMQQTVDWVYVAKSRVLKALRDAVLILAEEWPFENHRSQE
ncbi:MAG: sigma-70 family RNA polymerase sigma factor [Planctomycetes bacterium]|nr:sigma-70 family RNA polymerase sigma factor [Planctomycetota bacterium]